MEKSRKGRQTERSSASLPSRRDLMRWYATYPGTEVPGYSPSVPNGTEPDSCDRQKSSSWNDLFAFGKCDHKPQRASRRDAERVARHFSAGIRCKAKWTSPVGTADWTIIGKSAVPTGLGCWYATFPGTEVPGYFLYVPNGTQPDRCEAMNH